MEYYGKIFRQENPNPANASDTTVYRSWQSKYEICREISEGSYAKVKLACDKTTGNLVAIKMVPMKCSREGVPSAIIREISTLKELEHENIVRLLDVFVDPDSVNMILEYVNYTLRGFIALPNRLNPPLIKSILHQILSGVAYCHSHKILHRDLKSLNVLFDMDTMKVKIADFGLARAVEVPPTMLTGKIGTVCYRAPEILLGSTNYTEAVDIWSVGCIFAEMVIGDPIFYGISNEDVLLEVFKFFDVPSEDTWPGVTSLRRDISTAYKVAPRDKKYLREVVRGLHPDGFELLQLMLHMNPTSRIAANVALNHRYFKNSSA